MKIQKFIPFMVVLSFAIYFFVNTNWDKATWSDWGLVILSGICLILFIFNIITSIMLKRKK